MDHDSAFQGLVIFPGGTSWKLLHTMLLHMQSRGLHVQRGKIGSAWVVVQQGTRWPRIVRLKAFLNPIKVSVPYQFLTICRLAYDQIERHR
jgi:hypothetical protein